MLIKVLFYYKPIINCKYIPSGAINEGGSSIKVTIPKQPYTYTTKVGEDGQITFPKTIFEFNFDYIFSLKLFDTKTLVANVLNALLGLSTTIQTNNPLSIHRNIIRGEIRAMIKGTVFYVSFFIAAQTRYMCKLFTLDILNE